MLGDALHDTVLLEHVNDSICIHFVLGLHWYTRTSLPSVVSLSFWRCLSLSNTIMPPRMSDLSERSIFWTCIFFTMASRMNFCVSRVKVGIILPHTTQAACQTLVPDHPPSHDASGLPDVGSHHGTSLSCWMVSSVTVAAVLAAVFAPQTVPRTSARRPAEPTLPAPAALRV